MIKQYSSDEIDKLQRENASKTNWHAVDALPIDNNSDDEFDINHAELVYPKSKAKKQIAFRIDHDLLEFLKEQAKEQNLRGYGSLMHIILESYKKQKQK